MALLMLLLLVPRWTNLSTPLGLRLLKGTQESIMQIRLLFVYSKRDISSGFPLLDTKTEPRNGFVLTMECFPQHSD